MRNGRGIKQYGRAWVAAWAGEAGKRTVRSPPTVWLEGSQAHFAFLLRAWFADPYDVAANGAQFVAGDDLHNLSTPEPETAAKPEPFVRTIDNQAGNPLWDCSEVDDHAGSLPRGNPPRAANLMH
ncbi:MAG: hypothetical protein DMG41_11050 [Acidobacteria bacterium]|nr:MAG: hypothetical protein AUH13_03825 [Acidobacteria bacterium 13_2_20CM_58_27]PYT88573.1 MAG: hypothetical protein DMG41_11050 [Acidobacteriota bacterium]